jgi:uncharacterized membrane protein (UPF0182 family)
LPELKRVIVAFGNRLTMQENLEMALNSVLGEELYAKETPSPPIPEGQAISNLPEAALGHYNRAKDYLRQGDWAGYGKELENLEKVLTEMAGMPRD